MRNFLRRGFGLAAFALTVFVCADADAADTLNWDTNQNHVSAQIQSLPLLRVLEGIAHATGWQVYVESNASLNVSAKFKNLPSGDALGRLLGNLNYALVPETNSRPHLYVFRTSPANATQLVQESDLNPKRAGDKKIPNELIVRLKPGANIDELAKKLGAKVIGRIDSMNAYRLQFADAAAADAARTALAGDSSVAAVDSNYSVNPPPAPVMVNEAAAAWPQLTLNPPANGSDHLTVGIVDTAVQPLGNDLDKFLVKSFSEAGDANPDPNLPTHGTSVFETLLRAAATAENGGSASFQVATADVYGPNSSTSTFDIAKGITDLVNYGANPINISSGGTGDSQLLVDVIQQAVKNHIQIYAAAGNDASAEPFYPAAIPGVTAVTAGAKPGQLADYANYGSFVDLMAPGTALVSFGSSTWMVSGTSVASPYITGLTVGTADSQHVPVSAAAQSVAKIPAFQFTAK